jgi:hypothetical protein
MNESPSKKPPATVTSEPHELEHQIRLRAQELYEARGREDGHELDDWLRLRKSSQSRNSAPPLPDLCTHQNRKQHAPRTVRGPFHLSNLPLTFVRIALFSPKEAHGFFVLNILPTIYDGNNFALRTANFCSCFTVLLGVARWQLPANGHLASGRHAGCGAIP